MKLRKNISKIGALTGSALMATLSVASPVAADLGDLPQPFIQDGEFNGSLVVGEEAQTEDVLGAIDIASSFQAEATSPVSVDSGGSVTTVEGGEQLDENYLNEFVGGENLDDDDLDGFNDGTFTYDGQTVDFEEKINISDSAMQPVTSLVDEEYGLETYTEVESGEVLYYNEFTEEFDVDFTDDGDEDIEMELAGQEVEITDIGGSDSITIEGSNEYFLEQSGDNEVEVDGRTVSLENVGEQSVVVQVDGEQAVLDGRGDSERFGGNFEVELDSVFYQDQGSDNGANLKVGNRISNSVSDGDSAEIFGEPEDEDEADWVWDINLDETVSDSDTDGSDQGTVSGGYIGLTNAQTYDGTDDADDPEERNALSPGQELSVPNERAGISFSSLEYSTMGDITTTIRDGDIDVDNDEGLEVTDADGVVFTSDGDENLRVDNTDTEEAYYVTEGEEGNAGVQIWYEDGSEEARALSVADVPEATASSGLGTTSADTTEQVEIQNSGLTGVTGDVTVQVTTDSDTLEAEFGPSPSAGATASLNGTISGSTSISSVDIIGADDAGSTDVVLQTSDGNTDTLTVSGFGSGSADGTVDSFDFTYDTDSVGAVSDFDTAVDIRVDDDDVDVEVPTVLPGSESNDDLNPDNEEHTFNMVFPTETSDVASDAERLRLLAEADGRDFFGAEDEDETDDLQHYPRGGSGFSGIGTTDEPLQLAYGAQLEAPEDQFGSGDTFEFSVPSQEQEANYIVSSQETTVSESSGSSDSGAVEVNQIPVGLGVLDSDVVSNGEITGEGPMVVVGGPYANTAASALLDNPSSSEIESMFSPGQATIRMFDEPEALLVAGYNPEDTVGASLVVADYQDYSEQLTGDEVELVFDGSEDIEFQSPSMNASQ